MNKLEVTDEQLTLIQTALDFYSRIGIGQFDVIKDHPTFQEHLYKEFAKQGSIEIGDKTQRGDVVEIGKDFIKTKGSWGNGKEIKKWTDVENVKHSTDYKRYHMVRDNVDRMLIQPRNMLCNELDLPRHGSWGIHNPKVDDSCRMAFDIVQVIRHERYKQREDNDRIGVDSHIHFSHTKDDSSGKIKCKLQNI